MEAKMSNDIKWNVNKKDRELIEMRELLIEAKEALELAHDHLDYCGWGDSWERECAFHHKLPEKITSVLEKLDSFLEK
jgi:hypothetical protein